MYDPPLKWFCMDYDGIALDIVRSDLKMIKKELPDMTSEVFWTSDGYHYHVVISGISISFTRALNIAQMTMCDKKYLDMVKRKKAFFRRVSARKSAVGGQTDAPHRLDVTIDG